MTTTPLAVISSPGYTPVTLVGYGAGDGSGDLERREGTAGVCDG